MFKPKSTEITRGLAIPAPTKLFESFRPRAWEQIRAGQSLWNLIVDYAHATNVSPQESAGFVFGRLHQRSRTRWNLIEQEEHLAIRLMKLGFSKQVVREFFPHSYLRKCETRYLIEPGLRYCPMCAKAGVHLSIFQCAVVPACTVHGVPLTDTGIDLRAVTDETWPELLQHFPRTQSFDDRANIVSRLDQNLVAASLDGVPRIEQGWSDCFSFPVSASRHLSPAVIDALPSVWSCIPGGRGVLVSPKDSRPRLVCHSIEAPIDLDADFQGQTWPDEMYRAFAAWLRREYDSLELSVMWDAVAQVNFHGMPVTSLLPIQLAFVMFRSHHEAIPTLERAALDESSRFGPELPWLSNQSILTSRWPTKQTKFAWWFELMAGWEFCLDHALVSRKDPRELPHILSGAVRNSYWCVYQEDNVLQGIFASEKPPIFPISHWGRGLH